MQKGHVLTIFACTSAVCIFYFYYSIKSYPFGSISDSEDDNASNRSSNAEGSNNQHRYGPETQNVERGDKSLITASNSKNKPLLFLYLLQTEECLPTHLATSEALGNESLNFDVLVLSFRKPCDNNTFSHVQYTFDSSTTWTTGRNLLYETAMKRQTSYLYYIFMDDDVHVLNTKTMSTAWREFEEFLQSVEPAIMGLDMLGQNYAEKVRSFHKEKNCSYDDPQYVSGLWCDAMINAIHQKAIQYLLPYDSTYDHKSWWASQLAFIIRSEVLFRGQLVLHRYIRCHGSKHRPYPRDFSFTLRMFRRFITNLDAHLGAKCIPRCAQIMMNKWMVGKNDNGWQSPTLCLPPPPPHDPVEPCRYQCDLL